MKHWLQTLVNKNSSKAWYNFNEQEDFHSSLLEAEETLKFDWNFKLVEDKVQGNGEKKDYLIL